MTDVMDNNTALKSALGRIRQEIPEERIHENEPMAGHTSFRIGGPAGALVVPENEGELAAVLKTCAAEPGLDYMLIGNGSNFLVADEGYPGIFIKLGGEFSSVSIEKEKAGENGGNTLVRAGAAKLLRFEWKHMPKAEIIKMLLFRQQIL